VGKLITFYGNKTQPEMDEIWIAIKSPWTASTTGLTGNTWFAWTGTVLADALDKGAAYKLARDKAIASNATLDIDAANAAMLEFAVALGAISKQANLLQLGNNLALKSTGLVMAEAGGSVGVMDKAKINSIDKIDGVAGSAKMNIVKSEKFCHGTYIQTQVAGGPIVTTHSNDKKIIILTGFLHNVDYMVRVCYDGTDVTQVWSDWTPFQGN
jgi:hypothetical protein